MLLNIILAILPPTRFFALKRMAARLFGVKIGTGSSLCGRVKFYGGGRVYIGRDCWIGIGDRFFTVRDADIMIGDRCDLAPDVIFICGSHELGDAMRRAGKGTAHAIAIGNGTWIGTRATLLGGSKVGESSVIGAGALLLAGSYPPSSMITGSPASVRRTMAPAAAQPGG